MGQKYYVFETYEFPLKRWYETLLIKEYEKFRRDWLSRYHGCPSCLNPEINFRRATVSNERSIFG